MHFCIALLQQACNIPGLPSQTRQGIDSLAQILTAWKGNAALFPATVQALDALPRDAGKRYLAALEAKQKAKAQKV